MRGLQCAGWKCAARTCAALFDIAGRIGDRRGRTG